eukprot:2968477-Pyramimonas_sp.AAC.1
MPSELQQPALRSPSAAPLAAGPGSRLTLPPRPAACPLLGPLWMDPLPCLTERRADGPLPSAT